VIRDTTCVNPRTRAKMVEYVNRKVTATIVSVNQVTKERIVTKISMNVPSAVHVRMEERVPTSQEATSVRVMRNILEETVKQM